MNEPRLAKVKNNLKEKKILIIALVLVITLFIGTSYALLTSYDETEEVITVKTGNLNMEITTSNKIDLGGELPKSDEEGFENKEIKITLKNTGTIEIGKYEVKLVKDKEKTSTLEEKYIRESISEEDSKRYKVSNILSEVNNIIYTGYNLKVGESKVIYLKVWLDEEAGEAILNKSYNGSINVELYQDDSRDENLVEAVKKELTTYYYGKNTDYSGGLVAINNAGDLYNETDNSQAIREYRYNGPNVNNYVKFNDEVWQIVGVFKEGEEEFVKIVRTNTLPKEMLPNTFKKNNTNYTIYDDTSNMVYWNRITGTGTDNEFDWTKGGLQYYLNNEQDENAPPNYGYLHYLSNDAKNMIRDTKYYLGTITDYTDDSFGNDDVHAHFVDPVIKLYNQERSDTVCEGTSKIHNNNCYIYPNYAATWIGKIGLLYPSDYGYASNYYSWTLNSLTINSTSSSEEDYKNSNWIYLNIKKDGCIWSISKASDTISYTADFHSGRITRHGSNNGINKVLPTLYLQSNVSISKGNGTLNNPYILN